MPLMQMPIFIAMYQVVQRFPLTDTAVFSDHAVTMNTVFLWTNLEYRLVAKPSSCNHCWRNYVSQSMAHGKKAKKTTKTI